MVRITINKPAIEKLTDYAVTGMKRVGDAADGVKAFAQRAGEAANAVRRAADTVQRPAAAPPRRRGTSAWAASAWADFLGRFTGR